MSEEELIKQICKIRQEGFTDSFAQFCARIFSSYHYPPENLAAARMHAFYLRLALERLVDANTREELLHGAVAGDKMEATFLEITKESYQAALESDRPFCELFVEKWCRFCAQGGCDDASKEDHG